MNAQLLKLNGLLGVGLAAAAAEETKGISGTN